MCLQCHNLIHIKALALKIFPAGQFVKLPLTTVKRLLTTVGKSKASPIYPLMFHLYITHDAIRPENKKAYMVGESMLKYNVEPDEDILGFVNI